MILYGILLEVAAAALGTTSKQLIAYSEHVKKRWIFHIGASINIFVGPIVDASAYAFAPQVVVAPFACLDVIFNALTAPYTLHWQKEVLTRTHIYGVCLVAIGALFTAVFGSVHDVTLSVYEIEAQLTKPASIVYLSVELVAILGISICLKLKCLSPMLRGISLGVIAGVLMGNAFCVKGFIGLIRRSIDHGEMEAWGRPTPYILISCAAAGAIVGHIFMRKGLSEYKGVFMVTIFEGAHITAACLSGCIVMSEMAHAPWWQYGLYWCSVSLIVVGMLLINTAAADAVLGRSFHIAQSFADDEKVSKSIGRPYGVTFPQPIELTGSCRAVQEDEPLLQAEGTRHRDNADSDTELTVDLALEAGMLKTLPLPLYKRAKSVDKDAKVQREAIRSNGQHGKDMSEMELNRISPAQSPPKRRAVS